MRLLAPLALLAAAALATPAGATADGPDFYRLTGEAATAPPPLRTGPGAEHPALAPLPEGAAGLANFGCRGGLSFGEWSEADAETRAAAAAKRWCRVGHGRRIGWVPGTALAEGADTGAWTGGGRLGALAGSEWRLVALGAEPVEGEAWIAFAAGGRVSGDAGCNRLTGDYEASPGRVSFGPLAMTRMACPPPRDALEQGVTAALEAAEEMVATHLVLALFDGKGRLLATLARRHVD